MAHYADLFKCHVLVPWVLCNCHKHYFKHMSSPRRPR